MFNGVVVFLMVLARVPTGLCLMVGKFVLNHTIRSHMRIGHDESVPVHVGVDVFWYALAYLAYMVRASLVLVCSAKVVFSLFIVCCVS